MKFISCEIDTATTRYNVSISGADAVSFDGCYFEKSNESSFLIRGNGVNALNITNCYFLDLDFNLTFNGAFIGNAFRLINKESGTAIATESSTNGLLIGGNYIEDGYTTE